MLNKKYECAILVLMDRTHEARPLVGKRPERLTKNAR